MNEISEENISLFKAITCQDDEKAIEFLLRYSDVNTAIAQYFASEDSSNQRQVAKSQQQPVSNPINQPKVAVDQSLEALIKLIPSIFGHQIEIPSQPKAQSFQDSITIKSGESSDKSPLKKEREKPNNKLYNNNQLDNRTNPPMDMSRNRQRNEEIIIIDNDDENIAEFKLITNADEETARNYIFRYQSLDRAVQEFFNKNHSSSETFEEPYRATWESTTNNNVPSGFPTNMVAATQPTKNFSSVSPLKPAPIFRKRDMSDCKLRLRWHDYNAYVKKYMKEGSAGESPSNQWPKFLGSLLVDCDPVNQHCLSEIKVHDEIRFEPEEIEFGSTDIKRKKKLANGKFKEEVVGKNCSIKGQSLMVRCLHNGRFIGHLNCDLEEVFVFLLKNKYVLLDGVVVLNPVNKSNSSNFMMRHKLALQMDVFLTDEIIKNPLNVLATYGKKRGPKSGLSQNIEELSEEEQQKYQTLRLAKESLRKLFLMLKTKISIPTAVKFYQKVDPFQRIKKEKYIKMNLGQPAEIITKDFPEYYQGNNINREGELVSGNQNPFSMDDSSEDDEPDYDDNGRRIRRGYSRFDKPKSKEEKEQEDEVNPEIFTPETHVSSYYVACEPAKTLKSELHVYQKQALSWMKYREGCIGRQDLFQKELEEQRVLNDLFQEMELINGSKLYFNPFNGEVCVDLPEVRDCKGGILADEMGLGKTIMTIALLHSHRRPSVVNQTLKKYLTFGKQTIPEKPFAVQEQIQEEEKTATPVATVVKKKSKRRFDYESEDEMEGIKEEDIEYDESDDDLRLIRKNGKREPKKDLGFDDFFSSGEDDLSGFGNPADVTKKLKTEEEKPKVTISKILHDKRDELLDLMFKETPKKNRKAESSLKNDEKKPSATSRDFQEEEELTAVVTPPSTGVKKITKEKNIEEEKEESKKKKVVMNSKKKQAGTLIVVPLTVLSQWQGEIERHSNPDTISVYQYYGDQRKREKIENYDVVMTTYGTLTSEYSESLKRRQSPLFECEWFRVILDEGHYIRTRQTQISKAACALDAENRWCLTGTPLQNKLDDVFSLLQFLRVETWGEYVWWNNYINKTKSQDESSKLIRGILKMILLRRTKKSTYLDGSNILQLPPRESKNVLVKLSKQEKALYNKVFKGVKKEFNRIMRNGRLESDYMHILVIILRLRQVCDHPSLVFSKSDLENQESLEQAICHFLQQDKSDNSPLAMQEEEGADNKSKRGKLGSELIQGNLERFKTKEFEPCPVCYEDVTEPAMTKCGHIFCRNCIGTSLRNHNRCPLCQGEVSEEDVILVSLDDPVSSHVELDHVNSMESAKLAAVTRAAREVALRGEKVVIFSQFLGMLDLIQKYLKEARIGYTRIDGSLTMKERVRNIEAFTTDAGLTVFLISLKAGANGLNLTAANNVFLVDPWWNPAVEDQAIERVYRIGQKNSVNVKRFICRKTIEERVLGLNAQKNEMISSILQFNPLEKKKNNIQNMIYILQGFDEDDSDDEEEDGENHQQITMNKN